VPILEACQNCQSSAVGSGSRFSITAVFGDNKKLLIGMLFNFCSEDSVSGDFRRPSLDALDVELSTITSGREAGLPGGGCDVFNNRIEVSLSVQSILISALFTHDAFL
jgi:hypothetical protein